MGTLHFIAILGGNFIYLREEPYKIATSFLLQLSEDTYTCTSYRQILILTNFKCHYSTNIARSHTSHKINYWCSVQCWSCRVYSIYPYLSVSIREFFGVNMWRIDILEVPLFVLQRADWLRTNPNPLVKHSDGIYRELLILRYGVLEYTSSWTSSNIGSKWPCLLTKYTHG